MFSVLNDVVSTQQIIGHNGKLTQNDELGNVWKEVVRES
jgi:hypothetical protein